MTPNRVQARISPYHPKIPPCGDGSGNLVYRIHPADHMVKNNIFEVFRLWDGFGRSYRCVMTPRRLKSEVSGLEGFGANLEMKNHPGCLAVLVVVGSGSREISAPPIDVIQLIYIVSNINLVNDNSHNQHNLEFKPNLTRIDVRWNPLCNVDLYII